MLALGPSHDLYHLNPQCLQFKTDQQQDLKKLERMNLLFFALFSHGELPEG